MAVDVNEAYGATLTNSSGGALVLGDVVIQDTAAASSFTTTTVEANPKVLGVLGMNTADGATGIVQTRGPMAGVKVTGAVAIGDYLATSTTVCLAKSVGQAWLSGTFARALTAAAGPGAGTVTAHLLGGRPGSAIDVYNVRDYGATGDGVTDDIVAIQAAITAATSAGGGTILLPEGHYKTSATLNLGNGVILRGEGRESSEIEPNAETFAAITITGAQWGWGVAELRISYGVATGDVASTVATAIGIEVVADGANYPHWGYIADVSIYFAYRGIQDLTLAYMMVLDRVYVLAVGNWGIYKAPAAGAATTWTLRNCYVNTAAAGGFYFSAVHGLTMITCAADHCTGSVMTLASCMGTIDGFDTESSDIAGTGILFTSSRFQVTALYSFACDLTGATTYFIRAYNSLVSFTGCVVETLTYTGVGTYYCLMPDGASALVTLNGCSFPAATGAGGASTGVYYTNANIVEATATALDVWSTLRLQKQSGDPVAIFRIGGADKYYIGVDDSDSDKLEIGAGNAVGTTPYLTIDSAGNVGIGAAASAPLSELSLDGGLHVGGMSDVGDNNLVVDGVTTSTGLLTASAGIAVAGAVTQSTNAVRAVFTKTGIADNTETAIFTVTTTNEAGNTDGGGYTCFMRWLIGHAATSASNPTAAMGATWLFSRAMPSTGVGVNSTAIKGYEGSIAAIDAAARTIATEVVTITEISEYVQTVNMTVDLSGTSVSTAEVVVVVELVYTGFTTPPVLAAA